jgi:hypothetical protein
MIATTHGANKFIMRKSDVVELGTKSSRRKKRKAGPPPLPLPPPQLPPQLQPQPPAGAALPPTQESGKKDGNEADEDDDEEGAEEEDDSDPNWSISHELLLQYNTGADAPFLDVNGKSGKKMLKSVSTDC